MDRSPHGTEERALFGLGLADGLREIGKRVQATKKCQAVRVVMKTARIAKQVIKTLQVLPNNCDYL